MTDLSEMSKTAKFEENMGKFRLFESFLFVARVREVFLAKTIENADKVLELYILAIEMF